MPTPELPWDVLAADMEILKKHQNNVKAAAEELGYNDNKLHSRIKMALARGIITQRDRHEWKYANPDFLPLTHRLKGLTTYDKEKRQWVKTEQDRQRSIQAALEGLSEHMEAYKGVAPRTKAKRHHEADFATLYPLGDPHIGMLAHHEETGSDFDTRIAERECLFAVQSLVERSQPTEFGVLINLGDFFHADDNKKQTPASGNYLDVDTRMLKTARIGFGMVRSMIDSMLAKHKRVVVFNAPGNHDPIMARMLNLWIEAVYEKEPRVTVECNARQYMYWRFGRNLIGIHHGHTAKPEALPLIMVSDRKTDYGETSHHFWLTGHIHHRTRQRFGAREFNAGIIVESFRTLSPPDNWHHEQGYRSGREMQSITLHKEWGEWARSIIGIDQVKAGVG